MPGDGNTSQRRREARKESRETSGQEGALVHKQGMPQQLRFTSERSLLAEFVRESRPVLASIADDLSGIIPGGAEEQVFGDLHSRIQPLVGLAWYLDLDVVESLGQTIKGLLRDLHAGRRAHTHAVHEVLVDLVEGFAGLLELIEAALTLGRDGLEIPAWVEELFERKQVLS